MNTSEIFNKNILIQTSYHPAPHLETELEIIENLLIQKNTVYWLVCDEDFRTCFCNPQHRKLTCLVCKSRVNNGVSFILNKYGSEQLKVITYKQFNTPGLEIPTDLFNNINTLEELKAFKYKDYDAGMAASSSLISAVRDHRPDIPKFKTFINAALTTGVYLYDTFSNIVESVLPDFVILFNGRFVENRPLLRVCQNRGINYFTHERAGVLLNYLMRYNSIPHDINSGIDEIEALWASGAEDKEDIGNKFFIKRQNRVEESWYSFTKSQKKDELPESLNREKSVITIFNSSMDEYEGLEGFGSQFYKNDNDGIREICRSLEGKDDLLIYLRIHPNLKGLDNAQMKFLRSELNGFKNLTIINPEDEIDSYALIEASDYIVVFGSTIGVEATYSKKSVVLLGRAPYEHFTCIEKPQSHEEVVNLLSGVNGFESTDFSEALKYGYWQENQGIKYEYYKPINIGKGFYRGELIEPNKTLQLTEKVYNRLIRFLKNG